MTVADVTDVVNAINAALGANGTAAIVGGKLQITATNPANGIVRWWMDGQLIGDHTDVLFPTETLQYLKIAPVWGGVGDTKTELDFYRYDQVHLSGR